MYLSEVFVAIVTECNLYFLFFACNSCTREDNCVNADFISVSNVKGSHFDVTYAINNGFDIVVSHIVTWSPLVASCWFACRRQLICTFSKFTFKVEGLSLAGTICHTCFGLLCTYENKVSIIVISNDTHIVAACSTAFVHEGSFNSSSVDN